MTRVEPPLLLEVGERRLGRRRHREPADQVDRRPQRRHRRVERRDLASSSSETSGPRARDPSTAGAPAARPRRSGRWTLCPSASSFSTTAAPRPPVPPVTTTFSQNDVAARRLERIQRGLEADRQVAVADRREHRLRGAVAVRELHELLEPGRIDRVAEARRAGAVAGDRRRRPARAVALELSRKLTSSCGFQSTGALPLRSSVKPSVVIGRVVLVGEHHDREQRVGADEVAVRAVGDPLRERVLRHQQRHLDRRTAGADVRAAPEHGFHIRIRGLEEPARSSRSRP